MSLDGPVSYYLFRGWCWRDSVGFDVFLWRASAFDSRLPVSTRSGPRESHMEASRGGAEVGIAFRGHAQLVPVRISRLGIGIPTGGLPHAARRAHQGGHPDGHHSGSMWTPSSSSPRGRASRWSAISDKARARGTIQALTSRLPGIIDTTYYCFCSCLRIIVTIIINAASATTATIISCWLFPGPFSVIYYVTATGTPSCPSSSATSMASSWAPT